MKLFHLSDLHIGKRVNEFSMLEDQKYILMQILKAAKEHQPDGIILAGDIYDKPVPAAEAVQVFDDFLTSLNEMGLIVFMISGNHDSPERVSYGGRLMKKSGIYVAPVYEGKTEKVEFTDAYGKVCIHLLPFVKPAVVRHAFEEGEFEKEAEAVCDYQSAVKMTVSHMAVDTDVRNVLIAHQFVTGAMRCESEEVSVGALTMWTLLYLMGLIMWPWGISTVPRQWEETRCDTVAHLLNILFQRRVRKNPLLWWN